MLNTRDSLESIDLPRGDRFDLPNSDRQFSDGGDYRIEIPSVEGPEALEAAIDEASERDLRINRVSQGSGIMLQTGPELERMARLGQDHDIEVCLFVGPRAAWDIGIQATASSGRVIAGSIRGTENLIHSIEDVKRACEFGIRSVLVADIGLLYCLSQMRSEGYLPADLFIKVSIAMPIANPATALVLAQLGANSLNLPVDLPLPTIAALRQAVQIPLDIYVEGADDYGAPLRYYDMPEIARVASPVYFKFTVRNSPSTYPSGGHIQSLVELLVRERVRRASIGLDVLRRFAPGIGQSETGIWRHLPSVSQGPWLQREGGS